MNNITLNEGLDYQDMEGQVQPKITVDEYTAKMGKECDIITITFTVNSQLAGEDLVDWLERGYEWVLDASISEGEITVGKYLVFVEMNRRSSAPERIITMLSDLSTLTNIKVPQWIVEIDDQTYKADVDVLKKEVICSPGRYRAEKEKEEEINEMREIAGLTRKPIYQEDEYTKNIKAMAGM